MITKRFDPVLHAKTDKKAKNKVAELLKDTDYTVVENPNKHGVDLLVYDKKGNHILYIEAEIKNVWKRKEKFKWPDINFLKRKEKYCKLDKKTLFILFNEDLTDYFTVEDEVVLDSPEAVVHNKYVAYNEVFKKIPLKKANFSGLVKTINKLVK